MRMLAYGTPGDSLDENLKIGKSTTLECLGMIAQGVIETFGPEFLQLPTVEEERRLQFNENRGFPGMPGSIDCSGKTIQFHGGDNTPVVKSMLLQ